MSDSPSTADGRLGTLSSTASCGTAGTSVPPAPAIAATTAIATSPDALPINASPPAGRVSKRPTAATPNKRKPSSLLAALGVIGMERVEPVVIGALISGEPLLLIGPHGTGKSFLLCRVAEALGLNWRHYNASLLNYDDLVGYPLPEAGTDRLRFVQTPASIWGAQAVFIDEISRCRLDLQNKLFPIIHERRVQGIPLDDLVYRWSAMNPPPRVGAEDDEEDDAADYYRGSEPLDPALADRFAFVVEVPCWEWLKEEQQIQVILTRDRPVDPQAAARLRQFIEDGRRVLEGLYLQHGRPLAEYVRALVVLLREAGITLSPRRAGTLLRNILAVHAAWLQRRPDIDLRDSAWKALEHSLPQRACGVRVVAAKLSAAHRQAWHTAILEPADARRPLLLETDPLRRAAIGLGTPALSREELSGVVADALVALPPGARHALACLVLEGGGATRLCAAVAEQAAALYARVVAPLKLVEDTRGRSDPRFELWQRVLSATAPLPKRDPDAKLVANLLANLFAAEELSNPREVDETLASFVATRRSLRGVTVALPEEEPADGATGTTVDANSEEVCSS